MEKKDKAFSTRISEKVETYLVENFKTISAGLSYAAEAFMNISRTAKIKEDWKIVEQLEIYNQIEFSSQHELKGKLTSGEWKYLIDSLNGTIIPVSMRCSQSVLVANIEDSDEYEGLGAKWDVDVPALAEKAKALTGAQVSSVYTIAERFWDSNTETRQNLNQFIDSIK